MKFPLSLLKRFLITDASLGQIAATATAIGLEVESVSDLSAGLAPFVVAEILHAEKHPQADKLQVCRVLAAQGELQIVCGAPNARAGIKVALANIGTVIPTNQMEIKAAKVRGVESQGMLCSARELGLGEDHAGIIELPGDAAIGASIVDVLGLGDPVLDLNITANRGDCMGVYGIARDLAAAGLGVLKPLCVPGVGANGASSVNVTIEDADGCLAFYGRTIRGVKNGTSPEWLQRTLTAAGMRPISTLVDITNYFTLAFGRPLHVYDLRKLKGHITVRRAHEGEPLLALNEKTYTLSPRDCAIADDSGAIGIAGIMGGESTKVEETTTDIFLECAWFNPERIAKTGRGLMIDSDARSRFERGIDGAFLSLGEVRATELILELCGGVASDRVEVVSTIPPGHEIAYDATSVNALIGIEVAEPRQRELLSALGFEDRGAAMRAPSWRKDCTQPADLAEEILRLVGYDAIPLTPLPKSAHISRPALDATQARQSLVRRALAARGLHETYSWGFCSPAQAAWFGGQSDALQLLNPISADLSVMRPNLLPHLLEALKSNAARGLADAAVFEVGAAFMDTTPTGQRSIAAGVRAGLRHGVHWTGTPAADLFDVKADALAALDAAGFDASKAPIGRSAPAYYHPGRSGAISLGPKNVLAVFGEIHPATLRELGIEFPVMAFEVYLDAVPIARGGKRKALVSSDYQPVTRDFAFVVEEHVAAAELVKQVNAAEKQLLREVTIFDVYRGKGVPEGKKSIALTVTLQAPDRTLTDAEIEAVAQAILANVKKVGAVLR
jgi:phenylalanyl-tRNA synthetase beta chain